MENLEAQAPPALGVLEAARRVGEQAEHVTIHQDKIAKLAAHWMAHGFSIPAWNRDLHFHDGTERTVNYVLVLDALNFCFWPDAGKERWRLYYGDEEYSGYWGLAAALRRAIEEGIPMWDASYLASLTGGKLQHVLRGKGEIPMFAERLANLREVGRVLDARWNGSFARMVEAAGGSAVDLVRRVADAFSSFRDVASYRGSQVPLLKRAQILAVDLYGTFNGDRWGKFSDLERLTAFADYKLPQILRFWDVLEYSPALAERVDGSRLIKSGDPMEVEIRAATVWTVELIRQALSARIADGRPAYRAFEVDWFLWGAAQDAKDMKPYHLTRTIYY